MRRATSILLCLPLLVGCEPERGIRASEDFAWRIDITCVDRILRKTFGNLDRGDFVSDGVIFPKGTVVAQLAYWEGGDGVARSRLNIGYVGTGTRISHEFTGAGNELPQAAFPPALEAMGRASAAIRLGCGVNLSPPRWQEIGQDVEAVE